MHCGVPPTPPPFPRVLPIRSREGGTVESPPISSPPPHISNYYSFQRLWRIFRTESIRMSSYTVIVIVSIFCFYHFLIGRLEAEILTAKDWQKSVKFWRAWIFLLTPVFCDFLAWRASTTRPGQVRPYKLASRLWPVNQRLHEEETTSSEENTSKIREEPATVDFAGLKQ
jgi:hypothetical protein